MLDKITDAIRAFEKEIKLLEYLMQEALNEGEDVSGYTNTISKLETKIWRLETGIVN
mgnify:FL=1